MTRLLFYSVSELNRTYGVCSSKKEKEVYRKLFFDQGII